MAILIYPLLHSGALIGLMIAVFIAVSWAAGTVYVKWARIKGDPIANAAWQIFVAFVIVVLCLPFVEGDAAPLAGACARGVRGDLRRAGRLGARLFSLVRDHRARCRR